MTTQNEFNNYYNKISNTNCNEEDLIQSFKQEYVTMKTSDGWTVLHEAAARSRSRLLEYLIGHGASIDAVTNLGNTPLHWACRNNHEQCCEILLGNGANFNMKNRDGRTCLNLARRNNCHSIIRKLEEWSKQLQNEDKIFQAAEVDDIEIFQSLYTKPFHLYMKHSKTGICLYETIKTKCAEKIIKFLQYKQITKYEQDTYYKLFIDKDELFIKYLEDNEISKFFFPCYIFDLENKISIVNINSRTSINFKSPLQLSIEFNSLFIMGGINTHLKVLETEILLSNIKYIESLENIDLELLEALKQKKIYLSKLKRRGYSPIHIAIFENSFQMVQNILQNNPQTIEDGDQSVGTPIYHAIKSENLHIMKHLLQYSPNLDYTDEFGLSLTQNAILKNNDDIIDLMIDNHQQWNKKIKLTILPDKTDYNDWEVRNIILKNTSITKEETSLSLELKINHSIRPNLFSQINLDNIINQDQLENNLIHITTSLCLVPETEKLVNKFHQCTNNRNALGLNCLMLAVEISIRTMKGSVSEIMLKIIKLLNFNKEQYSNCIFKDNDGSNLSLLEKSFEAEDEKLLVLIIEKDFVNDILSGHYITMAIEKRYFNFLQMYITFDRKNSLKEIITGEIYKGLYGIAHSGFLIHINEIFNFNEDISNLIVSAAINYDECNIEKFKINIKQHVNWSELYSTGETLITKILKSGDDRYKSFLHEILLEKNCRRNLVNCKNIDGDTAIHVAVKTKKYHLLPSIVMLTQNINEANNNGETAMALLIKDLNEANEEEERLELFQFIPYLIQIKADIFSRGPNSLAPIEYCTNSRRWRCKIEDCYFEMNPLEPIPADSTRNRCRICQLNKIDGELLCGHRFCMKCCLEMNVCNTCKTEPTLPIKLIFD